MTASRRPFLDRLGDTPLVFDGAMGTELYRRGVFVNRCFDELSLSVPDLVRQVHKAYVDVGADAIETNTFGANRVKLAKYGFGEQTRAINRESARLAREAAGEAVYVAGAIGPLGIRIEPWGPTSIQEAREFFREQASALADGGVDLFILETFSDLPEIGAAIQAVRDVSPAPIIASMTIEEDGHSLEGTAPEVFAAQLDAWGADVVGVNCSVGPAAMLTAVERIAEAGVQRIAAMPNAGRPRNIDGRNLYLASPEYMGSYARRFIQAGARIVGGCCGTTPEYIRAIRRAVRTLQAVPGPGAARRA
jgi:homocysteine S-methyltransferase